jgi:transcriptional regulator with XRE-family HTH domain
MRYALKQTNTLTAFTGITALNLWDARSLPSFSATTRKLETTQKESEKPLSESITLNKERQQSTHLNSLDYLIERIKRSPEARANFVESHVDKNISYQIRSLRDRQGLSQEELAAKVDMNQNAISRLESPERGRPTITTLKRLAAAFDVALVVRFVPFSKLVKWVSGTPFVEDGLSTESLAVPNFDEELKSGALELPATTITPEFIQPPDSNAEFWHEWVNSLRVDSSNLTVNANINSFHEMRTRTNDSRMAPLELVAKQAQEMETNPYA